MSPSSPPFEVYIERGKKRTLVGAVAWPGWCRSGRDEPSALEALFAYAPRYGQILRAAHIPFEEPAALSALTVVERLEGNVTTDFGAPALSPASDARPVNDAELQRFTSLLRADWQAFDAAVVKATGRELRKGPRGGGRELENIVQHVLESELAYLASLGWKAEKRAGEPLPEELAHTRQAMVDGLAAAARSEIPERGPRGGARWSPRYFVRRVAWHVLDHVWEIEDRLA